MAAPGSAPAVRRLGEFGEFLTSRRARLQPADVGLPDGTRRRTPGLRREEVAQLAGVSHLLCVPGAGPRHQPV